MRLMWFSMRERGIWPMLRLVPLGSHLRSMPLVFSLVGRCAGRVGVAEVHRRFDPGLDFLPVGHFASLVPGERLHQVGRHSIQGFGYRPCHRSGGAVRDGGQEGVSA